MNQPQIKITQVKVGGNVVWQDPIWAYQKMIERLDKIDAEIETSELKEAKTVIAQIMAKK